MSDKIELKPCPFCGSEDLLFGGDDKVVAFSCSNCQAQGPNQYGRHEWNTRAPDPALAAKDAEITRLVRENGELLGSLTDLYNLISDSNAPSFVADADYGKITNAAVLIALASPIPDHAGGMPVEVE